MDRALHGTRKLRCAIYTRKSTEDGLFIVMTASNLPETTYNNPSMQ